MKISEMMQREDFYKINERTLANFYPETAEHSTLYIYPKLNAIVTHNPSQKVVDYLITEYSVRSSIKRVLTKLYVILAMRTGGLMADKKERISTSISHDTLIYPCNKKYRIFDFNSNSVSVIPKDGFDDSDLKHEIEFRQKSDNPDFVPKLIGIASRGYSESIINGRPLARMPYGYDEYKHKAYEAFRLVYIKTNRDVDGLNYAGRLYNKIISCLTEKIKDKASVLKTIHFLKKKVSELDTITLTFSHGDLQPGNIWIENNTNQIFIIDWESWGERSAWYDYDTLFNGLRPGSISNYLNTELDISRKSVVLLEDIIFQINELNSLPQNFGEDKFLQYIELISSWAKENDNG